MPNFDDPRKLPPREFFILGVTLEGKKFRPSDWAERLCGVMSCFQPEGSGGPNAHLRYSPFVRPTMLEGAKAVIVHEDLRRVEPLAYQFILDFVQDNTLQVVEACSRQLSDDSRMNENIA